jgi:hypothetical protein
MAEILTLVPEPTACDWCNAAPDEEHELTCPKAEGDDVMFCSACDVFYVTNCRCSIEDER